MVSRIVWSLTILTIIIIGSGLIGMRNYQKGYEHGYGSAMFDVMFSVNGKRKTPEEYFKERYEHRKIPKSDSK